MPPPELLNQFTPYYVEKQPEPLPTLKSGYTKKLFEPISIYTRKGPYILYGKRWYFRLVRGDTYKRARALMDDYTLNELCQHLVICYAPDKLPNNNSNYNNQIRIYAFFESYIEFYNYMKNFKLKDLSFYEVIFGEFPQKPHFDVDIDINEFSENYPGENVDDATNEIKDSIITACSELIPDLNIEKDILFYTSHGSHKRSFHLVINNKCHDNNKESKAFFSAVVSKINKYTSFIDSGVYSPRQQFRIINNQKSGSNRPKIFHEQFTYLGVNYIHKYAEDVPTTSIKEVTQLYESLASFTSGCTKLPSLIEPREYSYSDLSAYADLTDQVVDYCMKLLSEKLEYIPFTVKDVKGHYILLTRDAPSFCTICKRTHDTEHPYMYIINGKVYFDCRRSKDHAEGNKLFLGYYAMTLDELTHDIYEIDDVTKGIFTFGDYKIEEPELPEETREKLEAIKSKIKLPNVEHLSQNVAQKLQQLNKEREKKVLPGIKLEQIQPPDDYKPEVEKKKGIVGFMGFSDKGKLPKWKKEGVGFY